MAALKKTPTTLPCEERLMCAEDVDVSVAAPTNVGAAGIW
jgi:hypothetical protein